MVIYLKHPEHGTKVAISEQEAAYDEQNGWMRYNSDTPSPKDDAALVNELIFHRNKRKGVSR